jgi:hypothetical protein
MFDSRHDKTTDDPILVIDDGPPLVFNTPFPADIITYIISFDPSLFLHLSLVSKPFRKGIDNEACFKQMWHSRYPESKIYYDQDFPNYKFAYIECEKFIKKQGQSEYFNEIPIVSKV